jgi:hypothetical protein
MDALMEWSPAERSDRTELDELGAAAWVQAYDAAWLDRDWNRLETMLAPDVESVTAGHSETLVGRPAVIANLRESLADATVHEYSATDVHVRGTGAIRVLSYRWLRDETVGDERVTREGRDLLALRAGHDGWQLVRRIELDA